MLLCVALLSWANTKGVCAVSGGLPFVLCLQVKYQMLAAASFLAEVVKVLERVTTQTAAAASALPDEDMVSCCPHGLVLVLVLVYTSEGRESALVCPAAAFLATRADINSSGACASLTGC
jgi:hypothetical protein